MRQIQSTVTCLAVAVASLAALLYLAPSWASTLGLDVWRLPEFQARVAQEKQVQQQLEGQREESYERVMTKEVLAQEVADGRLTVDEAAERFRELNANAPEQQRRAWQEFTEGRSDEERARNSVLRFVRLCQASRSASRPGGADAGDTPRVLTH